MPTIDVARTFAVGPAWGRRVTGTIGRRGRLDESGVLEALAASLSKYVTKTAIMTDHRAGPAETERAVCIGPAMVFERLRRELGLPEVIEALRGGRRFEPPVERAVFLAVLHRLCAPRQRPGGGAVAAWARDQGRRRAGAASSLPSDGLTASMFNGRRYAHSSSSSQKTYNGSPRKVSTRRSSRGWTSGGGLPACRAAGRRSRRSLGPALRARDRTKR